MQAQQLYFKIEVQQPAAIQWPEWPASLLLVNNTAVQPADFGHQNKLNDVALASSSVDLSDAAKQMLFGLESSLFEQDVMEDIQVLEISQNIQKNFYRRSTLSRQSADSLCTLYGTEAVLALNQLVIFDKQEAYLTDEGDYYAYLEAYCSASWALYFKNRSTPYTFSSTDTLVWEKSHINSTLALEGLPAREQALPDMAYYSGEQLGRKLLPQWVQEDRYLYSTKDAEMQAAIQLVRRQRWQDALDAFAAIFRNSKKENLTRASAAANAAVCAEMMDDKKKATNWIDLGEPIWLNVRTLYARQQVVNLRYYKQKLQTLH